MGDLHRTHRQNQNNRDLRPRIHLQIPHNHDWNDSEHPIARTRYSRPAISHADDDIAIHTSTLPIEVARPEEGGRQALEDEHEEEGDGVSGCDGEDDPDEYAMKLLDREAEEHNSDAELEGHVGDDVDGFAAPPPLFS